MFIPSQQQHDLSVGSHLRETLFHLCGQDMTYGKLFRGSNPLMLAEGMNTGFSICSTFCQSEKQIDGTHFIIETCFISVK